jgi:hypothetical protein
LPQFPEAVKSKTLAARLAVRFSRGSAANAKTRRSKNRSPVITPSDDRKAGASHVDIFNRGFVTEF